MSDKMKWVVVTHEPTNRCMDLPRCEEDTVEEVVERLLEDVCWERKDCEVEVEERPRDWMMG